MDLVGPWQPIRSPHEADVLVAELHRELAQSHPLHGLPLRPLARRPDTDDVLFTIADGTGRVAAVHLTWRGDRETAAWPCCILYPDLAAWASAESRSDD